MTQTPAIGRIVHVLVDPQINNGSDVAPAVITRVWSEGAPGVWAVNVRALLDAIPMPGEWATSRYLHADEAAARAAMGDDKPDFHISVHAFWPAKV